MPFACKHWFSQLISIVLQMQSNSHETQKKRGLVCAEVLFSLMWFITALEKCSKYASSRLPPQSPALTVVDPCTMCGGAFLPSALDLSLHAVKRTEVRSPKSEFFPQSCNCVCEEEMKLPKLTIVFSAKEKYPFIKKHAVKVCIWRVLQGLEILFGRWIYCLIVEVKPFCSTTWGSIIKASLWLLLQFLISFLSSLSVALLLWLLAVFLPYRFFISFMNTVYRYQHIKIYYACAVARVL